MLGILLSVEKLRDTSTLKLNVPTLDVHVVALLLPSTLLSLNDKRALVIVARAEVMASNDVTTRGRIIFFIWLFFRVVFCFPNCGSVTDVDAGFDWNCHGSHFSAQKARTIYSNFTHCIKVLVLNRFASVEWMPAYH